MSVRMVREEVVVLWSFSIAEDAFEGAALLLLRLFCASLVLLSPLGREKRKSEDGFPRCRLCSGTR